MTEKKRKYEKPVIQDLGNILSGSAQMPMSLCHNGNSPSGVGTSCDSGKTDTSSTSCGGGDWYNYTPNTCTNGVSAIDSCVSGTGLS